MYSTTTVTEQQLTESFEAANADSPFALLPSARHRAGINRITGQAPQQAASLVLGCPDLLQSAYRQIN